MKIADFLWPRSREPVLRCWQGLRITDARVRRDHRNNVVALEVNGARVRNLVFTQAEHGRHDGHRVEYNDPVFGERMPEATAGGPVRRESHDGRDDAP